MLAAVEAAETVDVGCKRRGSPAMAEENPGGDAAEEALQEKRVALREKKKAGLLVLQNLKMYVAAIPLEKEGWEKSRFNLF